MDVEAIVQANVLALVHPLALVLVQLVAEVAQQVVLVYVVVDVLLVAHIIVQVLVVVAVEDVEIADRF